MKHKKLLIGLIALIAVLSFIVVATTYNSKQEALDAITTMKSTPITIDKDLVTATIISKGKCKIDYETETEIGCRICMDIYYAIENPVELSGECFGYPNSSMTNNEIATYIKPLVKARIKEEIRQRQEHNIHFIDNDMIGQNLTLE